MTTLELKPPSTLRRPAAKAIHHFRIEMVGEDTVQTFLENGWSLGIFCKHCPRCVEWTPPELLGRFGGRLAVPIADLVGHLACAGAGGCGSKEIAVGPHLYDGEWTWPSKLE